MVKDMCRSHSRRSRLAMGKSTLESYSKNEYSDNHSTYQDQYRQITSKNVPSSGYMSKITRNPVFCFAYMLTQMQFWTSPCTPYKMFILFSAYQNAFFFKLGRNLLQSVDHQYIQKAIGPPGSSIFQREEEFVQASVQRKYGNVAIQ